MIVKSESDIHNLAEAEYAIALFMRLRINQHEFNEEAYSIKLSDKKISIITAEKGQKELFKNMIDKKCSWHPLIGAPHRVITLEEYINEYSFLQDETVICSLTYSDVSLVTNHQLFTSEYH